MTDRPTSPFSGLDKALLRSTRSEPQAKDDTSQEAQAHTSTEVKKLSSKSARKSTSEEATKQADIEAPTTVPDGPLTKVGYYFTEDEIDLVDELHHQLRRRHRVRISKSDIVRLAIAFLNQNYQADAESSFLIKEARKKTRSKEA